MHTRRRFQHAKTFIQMAVDIKWHKCTHKDMGKMHLQCICIVKHIGISNKKQFWSVFPRLKCTYCIQWTDPDRGGRVGGRGESWDGWGPWAWVIIQALHKPWNDTLQLLHKRNAMPKGFHVKAMLPVFSLGSSIYFVRNRGGRPPRGRFTFFTEKSKNLTSHHHILIIFTAL